MKRFFVIAAHLRFRPALWLSIASLAMSAAISLFALYAWWLWDWRLATVIPNTAPLAPSSALVLGALAIAFGLAGFLPHLPGSVFAQRVIFATVIVLGAVVLGQWLVGAPSRWEEWLAGTRAFTRGAVAGRMSVYFAASTECIVIGWLLRKSRRRGARWTGTTLVTLAGGFCLFVLLSYASGAPIFYGEGRVPLSFLGALALTGLASNAFATRRTLRRMLHVWSGGGSSNFRIQQSTRASMVLALAVGCALTGAVISVVYLRLEHADLQARLRKELADGLGTNVHRITDWRAERLGDARLIGHVSPLGRTLAAFARDHGDAKAREDLMTLMRGFHSTHSCSAMVLFDRSRHPLLSLGPPIDFAHPALQAALTSLDGTPAIRETDLVRGPDGNLFFDLLAPIFAVEDPVAVGYALLRFDANSFIFPLLNQWAAATRSAEMLLVRRDGDSFVYLSPLRRNPGAALTLRRKVNDSTLLSAQLLSAIPGTLLAGIDYSGVPVLGVGTNVPGTRWFAIAQLEQRVAYAPLRQEGLRVSFITISILVAGAFGTGIVWRQRTNQQLRERLTIEHARQTAAAQLGIVMQSANDAILLIDAEHRIMDANLRALQMYGYTLPELRRMSPEDLRTPGAASDPGEQPFTETTHGRRNGTEVHVEESTRHFDLDGKPCAILVVRDISQRKAHEREIERLNCLYAALTETNKAIARIHDRDTLFAAISRILVVYGQFRAAWIGVPSTEGDAIVQAVAWGDGEPESRRVALDQDDSVHEPTARAYVENTTVVAHDVPLRTPTRESTQAAVALPVRVFGRKVGVLTVYAEEKYPLTQKEVTLLEEASGDLCFALENIERERAREAAERRVHEQAAMLDHANDAIAACDRNGRITYWNRGAERVFGWTSEEALARSMHDIYASGEWPGANDRGDVSDWCAEIQGRTRGGATRVLLTSFSVLRDESGRTIGGLVISSDITERKSLEEQFLRAQRLESIGMLAAGIAHDLNNTFAPIAMATEVLKPLAASESDQYMLNTLERSAERGAALVKQILAFSHGIGGEPRLLQPKHLIREIASVVTGTFPKSITLTESVVRDLWPMVGNPTQIHQVLLNLCVNARDAMPSGGKLGLFAKNVVLDSQTVARIPGARVGHWIEVTVRDTGTGMTSDVLERIWEPFFTTKAPNKGTGLGLSTVRGIVDNHKGFVTVQTELGKGSAFSVYFPAADVPEREHGVESEPAFARGAGELVLIADDEAAIRDAASAVLLGAGYRVITVANGVEALNIYEEQGANIKLVITDQDMPILDGTALIQRVKAISPDAKALIISGLPRGPETDESVVFLPKPFSARSLLATVSAILRTPAG